MRFTDNPLQSVDDMLGTDIVAGTDVDANADKKFSLTNLGTWILTKLALTLGGSSRTVKAAIDSLNNDLLNSSWVDISSYLNTDFFDIRSGYPPQVRLVGKAVYFRGQIYIKNALSTPTSTPVFSALPNKYRPAKQIGGGGATFYQNRTYYLFFSTSGTITVSMSNGAVQSPTYGLDLCTLNGLID